jgi:DNA-binding SARP family transcriptional activator/DNA-binding beta-propeller fold protein YncE
MRFLILGPLEVRDGEESVALGGGQQRKLLAILLVHANEVVSSDRLIDDLWGPNPPETATKALQGYVSQLRKRLGQQSIETVGSGYRFQVTPEQLDVGRFEQLLAEARQLDRAAASAALREALGLWRGPALADFAYDDFAANEISRLEELRLSCLERRIELDLACGLHDDVIAELETLVHAHPLRERFRRQLMLALYRSGRQAEALEVYQDTRAVLREELGLEPSAELQTLQQQILTQDESLAAPPWIGPPAHRAPTEHSTSRRRRPWILILTGAAVLLAAAVAVAALTLTGDGRAGPVVVPPNSVAMVDPAAKRIASYVGVGVRPVALAVGEGAVWVANADDGTVDRLDPKTGRLVRTIGIGADLGGIATGFDSVWVADGNDDTVTRIDPTASAIEARLSPGRPESLIPNPIFLIAVDDHYVWATSGSQLLRIDPETNRVDKHLTVGTPTGLATGGGFVWVTTGSERLLRIDARTATLTTAQPLPAPGTAPVFEGGSLWLIVGTSPSGQIVQIDPESLQVISAVTTIKSPTALGAAPGVIWVVDGGGNLSRIDERGQKVTATVHVGRHVSTVAADENGSWVAVTGAN